MENAAWRTLYELHSGNTRLPMLKSAWPEDHIDFLEDQGCVTVREYDGEIRVTSNGISAIQLMKSMSRNGDLAELNSRFYG
jgi:hypothetical protein